MARRVLLFALTMWVLFCGIAFAGIARIGATPDRKQAVVAAYLNQAQQAAVATPGACEPTDNGNRATAVKANYAAGFRGTDLLIMTAVDGAESGFAFDAANPTSSARGLAQILLGAHQDLLRTIGTAWWDPYVNARMAFQVWLNAPGGGRNFTPWVTYVSGDYKRHLRPDDCGSPVAGTTSAPSSAPAAWGGHANGRIPDSELCRIPGHSTHRLRCDAAAAFAHMDAAYTAAFGRPIGITDSYRSLSGQKAVYAAKPGLAAVPGTSNHGWGLAVDLEVGGYTDPRYLWLRANAPRFGWDNPRWARPGGTKREPWHFGFGAARQV